MKIIQLVIFLSLIGLMAVGFAAEKDEKNVSQVRMDFYAATNSRYYAPVTLGIWCANWELGCESVGYSGHFVRKASLVQDDDPTSIGILPRYDVSWERQSQ